MHRARGLNPVSRGRRAIADRVVVPNARVDDATGEAEVQRLAPASGAELCLAEHSVSRAARPLEAGCERNVISAAKGLISSFDIGGDYGSGFTSGSEICGNIRCRTSSSRGSARVASFDIESVYLPFVNAM